jgi:peptide/nickel transport system substrate-binding protein
VDSFNKKILELLKKIRNFFSSLSKLRTKKDLNNFFSNYRKQDLLDKKLVYYLSKKKVPNLKQIKHLNKFLNPKEALFFRVALIIFSASLLFLSGRFYLKHLQVVPIAGGEYTEGLIGNPKHINPLYAGLNDADNDISGLVFSSLFKRNGEGKLTGDLVLNYSLSEDLKVYSVEIRKDAKWHNGNPLTANDIIFTFNIIKNGEYNSYLRRSFSGVEIEKIDDSNIKFVLTEPYAPFLDLLTFGVMPEELWYRISPSSANLAELNLKPIGSGPYKFKSLKKDADGRIILYSVQINDDYYGQKPNIEILNFKFFPGFEEAVSALNSGDIAGISYLPKNFEENLVARDSLNLYKLNLPQSAILFFNQQRNILLANKLVRRALSLSIDKDKIIQDILAGDARLIDGPILPESFAYNNNIKRPGFNKDEAINLLKNDGWQIEEIKDEDLTKAVSLENSEDEKIKKEALDKIEMGAGKWLKKDGNFLIIKLSTVDSDKNAQIIEAIGKMWAEIGVKTTIEIVPSNQVDIKIRKEKNYEALLYSETAGIDPDVYAFWHSSRAGEGGLNLSGFSNKEADQLLVEARKISAEKSRAEKYYRFQEIVAEETPAVFLYSPLYTYVQNKKVKGFSVKNILSPSDRFANIADWYVKTGKKLVW